ncbi:MAG TPA: thioredoxin-disulfide reductase [Symbiobacteriaceae bacterium]|jgi:thioredoxin reductase (NADPH)|nr:thioredoxin-disulfide reductase [Symbiobacteriaceae bacterium]
MATPYDLIIVGGGPAGMTAAIYGARAKMRVLLVEKAKHGGQAATTEEVENWPGAGKTTGPELMSQFRTHVESLGVDLVKADVARADLTGDVKVIETRKGDRYEGSAVVLSPGAHPRTLGVKGEGALRGKGVSYCATCDADFFTDLDVVVVGNGDAAVEEAIYLTRFCNSVTMIVIHPFGTMDANKASQERLLANEKIRIVWHSVIEEIKGDGLVEAVVLKNLGTGERTELETNGVFIFIGTVPNTEFLQETGVALDDRGYIIADPETMATNVDGVFAAGDARRKWLRQIVTAASDGAIAACAAEKYLAEEEHLRHEVLEPKEPVLAVFWSPTSPQSLDVLQWAEQCSIQAGGSFKLARIDLYKSSRLAERFGVTRVPSVLLFHNGQVIDRLDANFDEFCHWINERTLAIR